MLSKVGGGANAGIIPVEVTLSRSALKRLKNLLRSEIAVIVTVVYRVLCYSVYVAF